jgi:hypothetical protein
MRRKKVSEGNSDGISIFSYPFKGHLKVLDQKQGGTGAEIPQPTKGFALMRIIRCFAANFIYLSVCHIHFIASEYLQWEVWGVFAMFSEYMHRINVE